MPVCGYLTDMLWHQMNQRRNIQKIVPLAHFKKEELKAKALALAVSTGEKAVSKSLLERHLKYCENF